METYVMEYFFLLGKLQAEASKSKKQALRLKRQS